MHEGRTRGAKIANELGEPQQAAKPCSNGSNDRHSLRSDAEKSASDLFFNENITNCPPFPTIKSNLLSNNQLKFTRKYDVTSA